MNRIPKLSLPREEPMDFVRRCKLWALLVGSPDLQRLPDMTLVVRPKGEAVVQVDQFAVECEQLFQVPPDLSVRVLRLREGGVGRQILEQRQ